MLPVQQLPHVEARVFHSQPIALQPLLAGIPKNFHRVLVQVH